MTKKKNQQQKKKMPKAKKQPKKRQGRGGGQKVVMGASKAAVAHAICAITDPFCEGANSGKWPDNSRTKTLVYNQIAVPIQIGANAGGFGSNLFVPGYTTITAVQSSIDSGGVTYLDALNVLSAPSDVGRWRITSWGLRIQCTLSRMTATGTCHIRLYSPDSFSTLVTIPCFSTLADSSMDIPLQRLIDNDEYIIPMPLGSDARLFNPASASPTLFSTGQNCGWQVVNVAVSGAPASVSAAVTVYMYYHVEYAANDGSSTYTFATPPPPSSPALQQGNASVLDRIGNFVSGAASKVEALFQSKAGSYAAAGIAGYLTAGPAGALANSAPLMIKDASTTARGIMVD